MRVIVLHDGQTFKAEAWGNRGNVAICHKESGRVALVKRALFDAGIDQAFSKFGLGLPGDTLYGWLWTNAGFHRLASN